MLGATEIFLLSVSVLFIVLVKCTDKNPPPIFGIYQRKSGIYWFKVVILYFVLKLIEIREYYFKQVESNKLDKFEKPQKLPDGHTKASDVVTFTGANKNGDYLIVNFGKRHQAVDGFFFLKIKGSLLGVLALPVYPNNQLAKADESLYEYSTEGLKLIPMEPMKKWRIVYKGKMVQANDGNVEHELKVDGVWTSDSSVCDNSRLVDNLSYAKCIAYEKWSATYFENFNNAKKDFYDQHGILKLTVTVDGRTYEIELETSKSRTIGNRIDDSIYYKAGLHEFSAENGDYFTVGQVCIPTYGSRIYGGVVYNSKKKEFYPVEKCSFELYKYGGIDASPDDYGFTFKAGGKDYAVQVTVNDSPFVYSGINWETKTYLKMSNFKVNGKRGWGIAKWIYKNVDGRNIKSNTCFTYKE